MAAQLREALAKLTILRRRQVEARTGLSCSALYRRIAEGTFPRQVTLGSAAVGWIESEVDQWIADRIAESRDDPQAA